MSGFNKFLQRRDKSSSSDHDKTKSRASQSDLHDIFHSDDKKKLDKDEEKKIKALQNRLARIGIMNLKNPQLEYALRADFAKGDANKAFELLLLFEDSLEGIVKEYDPKITLLGAVNREGVTCYLDALLFAMFVRLGSFEAMLYKRYEDEPRKRLGTLLRLWVNMLRSGKLIETDLTKHLQESLAACGWKEAAKLHQQDASEAFTFITEKLELPLLTLKMDIFHTGKEEAADDHRFVNERLLEVAIPPDTSGHGITLEDCLEAYFNNRIEVRRHLERRATIDSINSPKAASFSEKGGLFHIEHVEISSRPLTPDQPLNSSPVQIRPTALRTRAPSIVRDKVSMASEGESSSSPPEYQPRNRRKSSARKEVLMPAWQFFSLIPWYTENAPSGDVQVASHFSSKRPVLGLCLKRYSMNASGQATRLTTYVDIPLEISLPHFIQDDRMADNGPIFGNFKLVLQSVVCHRGVSVNSGHYIALVRDPAPSSSASSTDSAADRWMCFNDLASPRVSHVNITDALKNELPYLLFYQVQPITDDDNDDPGPPPYTAASTETSTTFPSTTPSSVPTTATTLTVSNPSQAASPRSSVDHSRRQSLILADPPLPSTSTSSAVPSRRGSRIGKSGSSQSRTSSPGGGERRLSATFSRLGMGMGRKDRSTGVDLPEDTGDEGVAASTALGAKDEKGRLLKKEKKLKERAKSRTRLERGAASGGSGGEERECVLM